MTIIYIRHAEKLFSNGAPDQEYSHDPDITDDGVLEANILGLKLVEKYGIPNVIYCSPLLRTRETLNSLLGKVEEAKSLVAYCDVRVGEYFGHWKAEDVVLTQETRSYSPIVDDIKSFKKRVDDFHHELIRDKKEDQIVWVITHGIFLKFVSNKYGVKHKHVPYLGYIEINGEFLTSGF